MQSLPGQRACARGGSSAAGGRPVVRQHAAVACRAHLGRRSGSGASPAAEAAQQQPAVASPLAGARAAAAACAAAAVLAWAPAPAAADVIQTVPAAQVTSMAKPLPKQTIDKPKVWVAFIGGAIAVFGLTVVAENNPAWFPAISRANDAMRSYKQQTEVFSSTQQISFRPLHMLTSCHTLRARPHTSQQQAAAAPPPAVDVEAAEVARQQAAVEAGLAEARAKVRAQAAAAAAAASAAAEAAAADAAGSSGGGGGAAAAAAGEDAAENVLGAQAALRSFKEQQLAGAQKGAGNGGGSSGSPQQAAPAQQQESKV